MISGMGPADEAAKQARILVVDDEESISELLAMALRYENFEVETAAGGRECLERFPRFRPDLVVLDVMMPGLDGFAVAKRLAEQRAGVPVVFLTARDTTEDKVRGLTLGGDDYVTKPFSVEELVARIRSILRRTGASDEGARLVFDGLELDEDTREVFRDGEPVDLTDTEFRLLRYLMLNPRRALTRAQILDHVWNYDFGGDGRVLETYISYLRRKVDRPDRRLIHTVRGVGYSLRLPRS
jgi:two-component system OmpR family response regulator